MADDTKEIIVPGAAATPMTLLDRALDRGADIDVIEKLMDLQDRWEKGEAKKAFDAAIADAKSKIKPVVKNRTGNNDKAYADLSAYAAAVDAILSENGLSYRYRSHQEGKDIFVTCILSHRGGYYEETTLSSPPDTTGNKNAIQAIGSVITYLQRYTLTLAIGLSAAEDDDGAAAGAPVRPDKVLNPETGRMVNPSSPHQMRKNGKWQQFERTIRSKRTLEDLEEWWADADTQAEIDLQPTSWQEQAREEYDKRKEALSG